MYILMWWMANPCIDGPVARQAPSYMLGEPSHTDGHI